MMIVRAQIAVPVAPVAPIELKPYLCFSHKDCNQMFNLCSQRNKHAFFDAKLDHEI